MREIRGQEEGGTLSEHSLVFGQLIGATTVSRGVRLILHGQITSDLTIEAGGTAEVHGMVCGDVTNRGHLILTGMVIGNLAEQGGTSEIDPKAEILNKRD